MSCLFDTDFGTKLNLDDDDFVQIPFSPGFIFNFYGIPHTSVFVNSNGNITFNSGSIDFTPTFSEFINNNNPRIAPYWIDLVETDLPGGTFFKQLPDRVIITWNMARYFGSGLDINTFQIVLFNNGVIGFAYESLNNDENQFPFGFFPLVGVASGNGGPSSIFKYDPPENFDPQQTVQGPKGILDKIRIFWVFNGVNYVPRFLLCTRP